MLNEYTRTYKAEGENVNVVEVKIYYALGGINYFTYRDEPRGYYFSISPLEISNGWRRYVGFSGRKTCVLECARQSAKRYEEAKAMMPELIDKYLQAFCEESGIKLLEDTYTIEERERKVS